MKPLIVFLVVTLTLGVALWSSIGDGAEPVAQRDRKPVSTEKRAVRPARPSPVPTLEPERSYDHQVEPAQQAVDERRTQLQAQFAAQQIDSSWAGAANQQLGADLDLHVTGDIRVSSVDCRSTLCRVELAPAPLEAQQQFVETWVRYRTWTGPSFITGDGSSVVMFVAKPGTELPI